MSDRPASDQPRLQFTVDGRQVEVIDNGFSLLAALRGQLGVRSPKAGCNPQGQCGCCTVLIDGSPRVACVTPARRVAGRNITTLDGLPESEQIRWSEAFLATGASQCGFCTPGIICRLEGLRAKGTAADDVAAVDRALAAHLCRCTGWQTIREAWSVAVGDGDEVSVELPSDRDLGAASRRATIEGHSPQQVSTDVAMGRGGFAEDTAPIGALVAMPRADAGAIDDPASWAVAPSLPEARALAGKVQGRHGTVDATAPIELPPGEWDLTLRTSWVEPAYLETDASWCEPGGEPTTALANGGAFGGKLSTIVGEVARRLADEHGRAVRAVLSREDVVRLGPKRPPLAAALRADGTGVIRVVRTPGIAAAIASVLPDVEVEEIDLPGPPTSADIRAAGWAEAAVLRAVLDAREHGSEDGNTGAQRVSILAPNGARAEASIDSDGIVRIEVWCGAVLDPIVLRSYVIGAAHMATGWVRSEGLAIDADGVIGDLTIRSFGVLRSSDTPHVEVTLHDEDREPINGSDAVFAAVAAAVWLAEGCVTDWPTGMRVRDTSSVQP